LRHAYNDKCEIEHIVRVLLTNYPRTQAWAENFKDYVWGYWSKDGNNWTV